MKLLPRTEPVLAWQCGGNEPLPKWARLIISGNEFVLDRKSGRQFVYPGEWLIKRLDSAEVEWFTDAMVQRDFEMNASDR